MILLWLDFWRKISPSTMILLQLRTSVYELVYTRDARESADDIENYLWQILGKSVTEKIPRITSVLVFCLLSRG